MKRTKKIGEVYHLTAEIDEYGAPYKGKVTITGYQTGLKDFIYKVITPAGNQYGAGDRHLRVLTKLERILD